jgi:beta-glucosidase/6-phospho-beta-glucosidase/beta-galactosidase
MTTPFAPGRLTWTLGIEDTCVYPADGTASLDEFRLTDHTIHRAADLELAARLGAGALRYGLSWPLVHTGPGQFRWGELDAALGRAGELGLAVIADLVHYGTPTWLRESFVDPGYPAAIADFAAAVASRYPDVVTSVTPVNEPLTTASFCGLRGIWPPRKSGWAGWTAVTMSIARGIAATTAAVRAATPSTKIVHVEAATLARPASPEAEEHVALLTGLGWLPTDLALGRVDSGHPLAEWLLRNGARGAELEELVAAPAAVDVIGVNYYPDLTPRSVEPIAGGFRQRPYFAGTPGLTAALTGFAGRYGLPVAITETSIEGDDAARTAWLRESVAATLALRDDGLDVRGYTWWPLLDFVDWSWAAAGSNVEEFEVDVVRRPDRGRDDFLRRMGLVRLVEEDGVLSRYPTAAAEAFRESAANRG